MLLYLCLLQPMPDGTHFCHCDMASIAFSLLACSWIRFKLLFLTFLTLMFLSFLFKFWFPFLISQPFWLWGLLKAIILWLPLCCYVQHPRHAHPNFPLMSLQYLLPMYCLSLASLSVRKWYLLKSNCIQETRIITRCHVFQAQNFLLYSSTAEGT